MTDNIEAQKGLPGTTESSTPIEPDGVDEKRKAKIEDINSASREFFETMNTLETHSGMSPEWQQYLANLEPLMRTIFALSREPSIQRTPENFMTILDKNKTEIEGAIPPQLPQVREINDSGDLHYRVTPSTPDSQAT